MNRYYVVYQFQKDGVSGTGSTTDAVLKAFTAQSFRDLAEVIKINYNYDAVIILSLYKLDDEVPELD